MTSHADSIELMPALPRNRAALGAMIGGFLVLHALLHLALAVSLSTSSYLVVSRVVDWGTIAVGALALSACVRHLRARTTEDPASCH